MISDLILPQSVMPLSAIADTVPFNTRCASSISVNEALKLFGELIDEMEELMA